MNLLPPPGPQRWRALALLSVILVVGAIYVPKVFSNDPPPAAPRLTPNPLGLPGQAGSATSASNSKSAASSAKKVSDTPVPLELAALDPGDAAGPEAGRNPFRFGEPPKPPQPPPQPLPVYVPTPTPPPPPPPVPQVELTLVGTMLVATGEKMEAELKDKRGMIFRGTEGDIIDGRYRLLKVVDKQAVVSFLDGSGQKTLLWQRVGG